MSFSGGGEKWGTGDGLIDFLLLTYQYEPGRLEEPFIVPLRMLPQKHITHSVVFPQPDGGIHHQTGHQTEDLLPHGKPKMLRGVRGVDHLYLSVFNCGRVHLSTDDLNHRNNNGRVLKQ